MAYLDTHIRRTKSMILRWHGRAAMFDELTWCHTSLVIVVLGDEYGKNLVINCCVPKYICGPTAWPNSKILLQKIDLESGREGVLLTDENNGVRVISSTFEVSENVKLKMFD